MPVARPESSDARIIAHVDMDCFYVQVEQRRQPDLRGLPTAVVQYNDWMGGGLIAVGYEARTFGVKRSMRGDEAKKVCPEINLVQVPVARGKADLNIYRNAGSEVVAILSQRGRCERASIDEVYLDLTDAAETMLSENPPEMMEAINDEALKSHVLGVDENEEAEKGHFKEWMLSCNGDHRDMLLACGAIIVAELRLQVLKETEFTCSAGIAHNKMLAKLASAMNKPAQQTVVPLSAVNDLLASLPVKKLKQLGGKLGTSLQTDLGVNTVGDLLQFSEANLQERYGVNTGTWLWNVARGINGDPVEGRLLPKSHGSGKTFPGPRALKSFTSVERWLDDLCEELSERIQSDMDLNNRVAHTLTLNARVHKTNEPSSLKKFPSKSCPLRYGTAKLQEDAKKLFNSGLREFLGSFRAETHGHQNNTWAVTGLSVTAGKILATSGTRSILNYFHGKDPSSSSEEHISNENTQDTLPEPRSESFSARNTSELLESKGEETQFNCNDLNLDQDGTSKDKMNNKGSILRFFGNQSEPQNQTQQGETRNHGKQKWNFNVDEIDPTVIDELPQEIQDEVRGWLKPPKRPNTSKRRSNISQYFLPARDK
ncbi:DNA-directed DNA polymerase [Ranunculus cassubicifolius]